MLAKKLLVILSEDPPSRLPKKVFKPKCPDVSRLETYAGSAPTEFWDSFPSNRNIHGGCPFPMDADRLEELAAEAGVMDVGLVQAVANDIRHGADLKVDGERCKPYISKNAPSAYKRGREVTDSIADGIKKRILAGPFKTAPN